MPRQTRDHLSSEELAEARRLLEESAKPAMLGELGGFRPPDTNNRLTSWWGGNFVGLPGEAVPICEISGRVMHPILQTRFDEFPNAKPSPEGIALLSLWMDLKSGPLWNANNGQGFCVRAYESLAGLTPIGLGYREYPGFPVFPIRWHAVEVDLPDWSDFAFRIPDRIAQSHLDDWFFSHPATVTRSEAQKDKPIKFGGYPQWWQDSSWPDGAEFVFQLDSTSRGRIGWAGGSAYFFRKDQDWSIRIDTT